MCNLRLILIAGAIGVLSFSAKAGPLTEAKVTRIVNNVQVLDPVKGAHAAALQETIRDEIELKTGVKSRSELLFQDETLTRIGPETSFSFKAGTRDMSLGKGSMLLQVPKGLGGAKIRTAAVTASITGTTIMIEHTPRKHIKVLVLEGGLRLSVNGRFGNSVVLRPGNMVLMRPDAKKIPPPVSVDLKRIMRTSSLVNMSKKGGAQLPSTALIEKEIAQQTHDKATADLVETNLVLHGSGTTALNTNGTVIDVLARNEQGHSLFAEPSNSSGATTGSTTPAATPAPTPSASSSATPPPVSASSPTPAPGASPVPTPVSAASPPPVPGASPAPTPVSSSTPVPAPSPGLSGDDKDKDKGDHNDDGHGDNGKGKGKSKEHPMNLPPPAIQKIHLSTQQPISPLLRLSRNEH
ncbi:MAG: hypothetical protein QOG51_1801 [Verrucomicrobiota bacterium]|jgi:hypothetical protein